MSTAAASAALPEEHPAARSARVRRDAADRARRWRDTQREQAETDAAIAKAVMLAVGGRLNAAGTVVTDGPTCVINDVVGHAAYILGGRARFDPAKARVLARFSEFVTKANA